MDQYLKHLLSDNSDLIIRATGDFCQKFLTAEAVKTIEEKDEIPKFLVDGARDMNIYGLRIPEEYGGSGLDLLTSLIIHETIASYSLPFAIYLDESLFVEPLLKYGNEEQKREFLGEIAKRGLTTTSAMTEPQAGSDVLNISTTATMENGKWRLNGNKIFITMGDQAEFFLIFAKTNIGKDRNSISAFLGRKDDLGLEIGRKIDKIGQRGVHINELTFNNLTIEKDRILGNLGQGYEIAMYSYDYGRLFVAAQALGLAEELLKKSVAFSKDRIAFGQRIEKFQLVKDHLASMNIMTETARSLIYRASFYEGSPEFTRMASIAKYYSTEVSTDIARRAIKIHGAMGVTSDGGIERNLRDSVIQEIYEGTNEIQKLVISREISEKYR